MKPFLSILAFAIASSVIANLACAVEKPLSLHPDNPHYFLFRDKPTILVTPAEHYGAVLNRDFDFTKYLDELETHGLNLTRTFTGVYCEDTNAFGITRNTLAPTEGKLICPWARSDMPGYEGGGNKFEFIRMKPDEAFITGGLPDKGKAIVLSEHGKQFAVYFFGGPSAKPTLALPAGQYQAEWLSPITGKVLKSESITAKEIPVELTSPDFDSDIALRIMRIEAK